MDSVTKSKPPIRMKVISMGNAEVGKSCIIKRYCEKRFVSKYLATIGIDYGVTRVTCRNRDVKVNIFDMAGQPYFYEIRNEFYSDTQGVLLVYDVTNRTSFDALESWIEEIQNELGPTASVNDNVVLIVCANKIDKKRVVDEADGRLWADAHGFPYFEVSACNGQGISEMFEALFEGIVAAVENGGKKPASTVQQPTYTREQAEAIQRLKNAKDDYQRLGLTQNATADDINKAFRKLSVLLHPDKSVAPGSEEAFKILVTARTSLLKQKTS